jgi:hypothetical protein
MRVSINATVLTAKLSTLEMAGWGRQSLVVENSIALSPEDVSLLGCVLAEGSDDEREALRRAGFGTLLED